MRSRFDEQLQVLNDDIIEMGNLVEGSINAAITALLEQNIDLAKRVIEADIDINEKENEIESKCLKILLSQQPVAKDLRLVSSALKMITDMERIGDQAQDISEITIQLHGQEYIKKLEHIPQMADEAIKMLKGSIDAFIKKDTDLWNCQQSMILP